MENGTVFNPLDKRNLGKSVVDALLESRELPLKSVDIFPGAGVYAIYYRGNYEHYKALARLNKKSGIHPIYVGKAIPKGGRKGVSADASLDSTALSKRLQEHRSTIEAVPSLRIGDFSYRCLVVDDIWISLGEALVIQRFQPLWNRILDGFGNHSGPHREISRATRPIGFEKTAGHAFLQAEESDRSIKKSCFPPSSPGSSFPSSTCMPGKEDFPP